MQVKHKFKLGDRVTICSKVLMEYDERSDERSDGAVRRPVRYEIEKRSAMVVGAVNRPIGTYVAASSGGVWVGEGDYDPPSLKVTGTVNLIQCKTSLHGRIIEVFPYEVEYDC